MTVETVHFPADVLPYTQRLTPDVGPGQILTEDGFSGAQSVVTFHGAERWRLEMAFADLTDDDRAEMSAFVTRLRVAHNVFLCVNHTAPQRGVLSGSPRALGSLSGQRLNVYNLTGNVASWARAGDFLSVNSQLKMVLEDAGTSAGGVASLYVWPPLYDIPNCNTVVHVSSPCGGFRMTRAVPFNTDPPGYRMNLVLTALERINSSFVSEVL